MFLDAQKLSCEQKADCINNAPEYGNYQQDCLDGCKISQATAKQLKDWLSSWKIS